MSNIVLMGPGGTGKSMMATKTAVHRPVHVLDVDDKLAAMDWVQPLLAENGGDVTYWPLRYPVVSDNLETRAKRIADNLKPEVEPKGWREFARMCRELDEKDEAKNAGTVVVDSVTRLSAHLKPFITYCDKKGTGFMSDRDYGIYLQMWIETVTILHDWAQRTGKDMIYIVHEKPIELPREGAIVMRTPDSQGVMRRQILGVQDLRIGATIEGQFPLQFESYFEEVYALRVEVDGARNPKWICRVQPDGVRSLRTSRKVTKAEFNPDFREIWGSK